MKQCGNDADVWLWLEWWHLVCKARRASFCLSMQRYLYLRMLLILCSHFSRGIVPHPNENLYQTNKLVAHHNLLFTFSFFLSFSNEFSIYIWYKTKYLVCKNKMHTDIDLFLALLKRNFLVMRHILCHKYFFQGNTMFVISFSSSLTLWTVNKGDIAPINLSTYGHARCNTKQVSNVNNIQRCNGNIVQISFGYTYSI